MQNMEAFEILKISIASLQTFILQSIILRIIETWKLFDIEW